MTEAFLKAVNMSISGGWLVLAVLVLRLLLSRAPKWVNVLLWGMVAVRLLCPFSLESGLSLVPSAETVRPEIMTDWSPEIDTGVPILNEAVNPVLTDTFAPNPGASANPLQILIPICSAVWLAGIAGLLLYTAVSYALLRRRVSTAVKLRYNIFRSEYVTSPFVLGLARPRIYLPYAMPKESVIYVVAHEKAHIRRKDHWWKPLGFLLLTLHWFNPLMWLAYKLFCRDIELACDENVIQNMKKHQRADYAQALLACSVNRRMTAACPIAFGEVGVKSRIRSVANYRKPAFWVILLALAVCAAAAVCFLTNPVQEQAAPTVPDVSGEATDATDETENSLPADTGREEAADLAYFMELGMPGKDFRDMDGETLQGILEEYGTLLDDYDLIARESTDGTLCYVVGCWDGAVEDSPLYHLRSSSKGDENGEMQVLYDERDLEAADKYEEPEYKYVIHNSHINHSSQTGHFLIHPTDSGWGFNDVFNRYLMPNGRAYMLDAAARGISLCTPQGPYLEIGLISEQWGEIYELIALTEGEAAQILSEKRQKLEEGHGIAAVLYWGMDMEFYTESSGITQTILDLAVEKCGYQFATPGDIGSDIVEARLDCGWLEGPRYADETNLARLQGILRKAEFGYVGKCGYGAKLTIQMADGSELVLFKGTDSCDTIVFGSYGGYFLGDTENREFWRIFGLDSETKEPLN